MPSFKHAAHTGETARSWDDIVAFYAGLAEGNAAFGPLASLSARLAGSDFVGAGLCGLTSMHDLLLGPSRKVLGNPYLLVQWDFKTERFRLVYEDGSKAPWERFASDGEVYSALERFFTKRARWYRGVED